MSFWKNLFGSNQPVQQNKPITKSPPASATDPSFEMTVEDIFFIKGRGTVVTGKVSRGSIQSGSVVFLKQGQSTRQIRVLAIEQFRKTTDIAHTGDNVGLLLENVDHKDITRGDQILGRAHG